MFNFLVKFDPWADGRDTIAYGRAFEHTEQSLVDKFKPEGQLDLVGLSALPTLFAQETSGLKDQVARVGTITGARKNGTMIALEYSYDLRIPHFQTRPCRDLRPTSTLGTLSSIEPIGL